MDVNKEVFDAEVFAILRAVQLVRERDEGGQDYTIFSNLQAAVSRIKHGRYGPAQALTKAVMAAVSDLSERGNRVTVRWTPAHKGVERNEQADAAGKPAAGGRGDRADPDFLREASLYHLMRETAEARSQATGVWIRNHVKRRHRYCPPSPGGKLRKRLARVRKELDGRFYQLLSGQAATAENLSRVG